MVGAFREGQLSKVKQVISVRAEAGIPQMLISLGWVGCNNLHAAKS